MWHDWSSLQLHVSPSPRAPTRRSGLPPVTRGAGAPRDVGPPFPMGGLPFM